MYKYSCVREKQRCLILLSLVLCWPDAAYHSSNRLRIIAPLVAIICPLTPTQSGCTDSHNQIKI